MATIRIRRQWPDGDVISVAVEVDNSFPDVVAEARQAAVKAFEDALGVAVASDEEPDE